MNVAIYARVSHRSQDLQRQIDDLTVVAKEKGYVIIEVITEKISGTKKNSERNGLQRVITLAESGKIKKCLVTEISRLGRKTLQVLKTVETLTDLGVSVYIQNYGIETLSPTGKRNPMVSLMLTMLSEFASLEREFIVERTMSGMARAKREGKRFGRPTGTTKSKEDLLSEYKPVVRTLREGISLRKTAKIHGISVNTVRKVHNVIQLR
jgi:DNA invertase Pin-like site-specific DNA recombinase